MDILSRRFLQTFTVALYFLLYHYYCLQSACCSAVEPDRYVAHPQQQARSLFYCGGLHVLLDPSSSSSARCCDVAEGFICHGPERLRTFRAGVLNQGRGWSGGRVNPFTTGLQESCKQTGREERASGVIRPKEGGSLPSIVTICSDGASLQLWT